LASRGQGEKYDFLLVKRKKGRRRRPNAQPRRRKKIKEKKTTKEPFSPPDRNTRGEKRGTSLLLSRQKKKKGRRRLSREKKRKKKEHQKHLQQSLDPTAAEEGILTPKKKRTVPAVTWFSAWQKREGKGERSGYSALNANPNRKNLRSRPSQAGECSPTSRIRLKRKGE